MTTKKTDKVISMEEFKKSMKAYGDGTEEPLVEDDSFNQTDYILEKALKGNLTSVVVLGYTEEGNMYLSTDIGRIEDILLLMELSKRTVIDSVLMKNLLGGSNE